jgi:diguanylate cyclase (GGDEF)-like protein
VLFFDVDDFKLVNDELGHATGDALLVEVANRLAAALRPGDTAARVGGDEFAVLLEDTDADEAVQVAERVVGLFASPFTVGERRVVAQASVGGAVADGVVTADLLMRNADIAMYEAKRRGKGTWQMYDPSLSRVGVDAVELRADLKQAIAAGDIQVAYQPIVDFESRKTVAVEALARWTHPTRGVIPPAVFIPIAEGSDLIATLGLQVLTEACRYVQELRTARHHPDLRLSVNLSARQLLKAGIVDDVRDVLVATGLDPSALTLEITEGVVVDDAGRSIAAIEEMKALGVRIAIDDFGTGFSSLSYLSRLPIDVLKIDRSFVVDMERSRQATVLVRSIVRIGQTLHLETVAEGVETEAQAAQLLRLGARFGQGYLFARPMSRGDLEAHLRGASRRPRPDKPRVVGRDSAATPARR